MTKNSSVRGVLAATAIAAGCGVPAGGSTKPPVSTTGPANSPLLNPAVIAACAADVKALTNVPDNCKYGFHLDGFPESQKAGYIAQFPVDCYLDPNQLVQCFFDDRAAACNAAVVMNNTIENNGTKWKLSSIVPDAGSTTDAECVYDTGGSQQQVHVTWQNRAVRSDFLSIPGQGIVSFAGPYRNQPDSPFVYGNSAFPGPQPGFSYSSCPLITGANGQMILNAYNQPLVMNQIVLGLNANAHGGKVTSDLAGYEYPLKGSVPCPKKHPTKQGWCMEPDVLGLVPHANPQVHHMVPAHYPKGCNWGKNSMANALVISSHLNNYFTNDYPETNAVKQAMAIPPYPTFPVGP